MFQGPSIREVQAAVGDLREASLCVVEAIQAWQRARQEEVKLEKKGGGPSKDPSVASSGHVSSDPELSFRDASNVSHAGVEHDQSAAGEVPEDRESPQVKFPVVPDARPVLASDEDLPVFLWLPPAVRGRESGGSDVAPASSRSSLDPETAVPEKVGHDLNGDAFSSAMVKPNSHRHSDNVVGSAAPATACDGNNESTSNDKGSLAHHAQSAPRTSGVNYLTRMTTDTDFIGAPGSVLADFFPPDTKLFRNPFILGHNLDDTLAVFASAGGISPHDRGHQDGVETAVSSSAALKKSRLDTRRVRHAAATIVAEEARERSGKAIKDSDGVPSGIAPKGGGVSFNTSHDGQRSDRPDSGCSRDTDGDHGGSDERSKKRRGKGGITFEDQQGKGRHNHGITLC